MWQVDTDATSKSSGFHPLASPPKLLSDEPAISALPDALMMCARS
jgi:hypothetical protein